ncbi:MAG: hypothetical protein SOX69_10270, partial [Oscillospiraceae bacterium]|nr:hypothetical protein [Oscillospiraceae bacterium]
AHRLRLRSSPRTLPPSFLLSSKSLARFGCSLINALTTPRCRYQLFAVSRGKVLCINLPLAGNTVPISLHRPDGFRFPPVRVVRIITHPLRRFLP